MQLPVYSLGNFIGMPLTFGSLFQDFVAFALGCLAGRDRWLEELVVTVSKRRVALHSFNVAMFAAFLAGMAQAYGRGVINPIEAAVARKGPEFLVACSVAGVMCITMSLSVLVLSRDYGSVNRFFSRHAFGVYVIHPPVLNVVFASAVRIIEAWPGRYFVFAPGDIQSGTPIDTGPLAFGIVYTLVLAQLASWACAWAAIRFVPGAANVL